MTVTGSAITGCFTPNSGGAIFNGGTMTVTGSTITGSSSPVGGAIENSGTMTVTGSTIDDNSALFESGGAIDNGGTMAVVNSTIANNTCESNDSPFETGNGGGINDSGTLTVTNSTIASNSVLNDGLGAGLYINPGAIATLNNSSSSTLTPGPYYLRPPVSP